MESDVMIPIGKRLAEIRRSHHVTQETLADRLGVSPKHISIRSAALRAFP